MIKVVKEKKYSAFDIFSILLLIFVLGGVIGFILETAFYRIDLGYFVKRGTTFGPWIPIYGFGAVLMSIFTYRYKDNGLLVFLVGALVAGILEFGTGYFLFHVLHERLWDYNTEMLNFGNIGGYICFRSIFTFGLSSLFLIYTLIPAVLDFFDKKDRKSFYKLSIILASLFIIDYFINIFK